MLAKCGCSCRAATHQLHRLGLLAAPFPQINGSTVGTFWQCLGTYALPGQLINVTVPASVTAHGGATLHIGGWTDTLYK